MKTKAWHFVIIFTLAFSSLSALKAQGPSTNLMKYWKYRERLKNFVVQGNCQGCSLVPTNSGPQSGFTGFQYTDQTSREGFYIGMLAMEYKILTSNPATNHPNQAPLSNTIQELYYAMNAFNRLDESAEKWMRYLTGDDSKCPTCTFSDLNGFFVRDDVSGNTNSKPMHFSGSSFNRPFLEESDLNGIKNENDLTSCLAPLPDGTIDGQILNHADATYGPDRDLNITSSFNGDVTRTNPLDNGLWYESQDQVTYMLVGLALVSKCVPSGVTYNNTPFMDGYKDFLVEAQNITARMIGYISTNGWTILNPLTGNPVVIGQNAVPNAYGFQTSACAIMHSFDPAYKSCTDSPIDISSSVTSNSKSNWDNTWGQLQFLAFFGANQSDNMRIQITLSTLGGIWNADRISHEMYDNTNGNKGPLGADILPLLAYYLWNDNTHFDPVFYEGLLDLAPCQGDNQHSPNNTQWDGSDREWQGGGNGFQSAQNPGVDYMYIFNLYCLANPGYVGSPNPYYYPPKELCPTDLVKIVNPGDVTPLWHEMDDRNFYASNSITAGNGYHALNPSALSEYNPAYNYIIENDNDANSPQPMVPANVTFATGGYSQLTPGFKATYGVNFHAYIDKTIESQLSCDLAFRVIDPLDTNKGKSKTDSTLTTGNGVQLNAYPNPAQDQITISFTDANAMGNYTLKVISPMGQVITEQQEAINSNVKLNVSSYPTGAYIILAYYKGQLQKKKFVKS